LRLSSSVDKEVIVRRIQSTLFALGSAAALALTLGIAPAFAQAQAPPPQPQPQPEQRQAQPAKDATTVSGEIVSVDATAKSLTIKVADGTEQTFMYNDATQITGAKDGAAGLATMREGKVTVHFKDDPDAKHKLATRIIVQPKA
jgi:hypothetical protein